MMVQNMNVEPPPLDDSFASPPPRSRKHYKLKTALDVAELFAKLDAVGREILMKDLISTGHAVAKLPPLVRVLAPVKSITWIDDDKGRGTYSVRLKEDGPEIAQWPMFGDGDAKSSTATDTARHDMNTQAQAAITWLRENDTRAGALHAASIIEALLLELGH